MIVITVHDKVGSTWSNPVVVQNPESAKRDFLTACRNSESMLGQHPTDFELYAVADWLPSLEDGKYPILRPYDVPKHLMTGEPYAEK